MIEKSQASYLHSPDIQYQCRDCPSWIEGESQCVLHGPNDVLLRIDSCNYFVREMPGLFGQTPLALLTKEESGATRNAEGFSCKRCEEWDQENWSCSKVDKDTTGADPGMIHPDACCNLWKPDPIRSQMPTDAFYSFRK